LQRTRTRSRSSSAAASTPPHATQLSGEERTAAWQRVITAGPRYAGYEKKTDRQIPTIRITAT